MNNLIDFSAPHIRKILKILLKDRTTCKNIIFATEAYNNILFSTEIKESMLYNGTVDIRPRVSKSMENRHFLYTKKMQRYLLRHGFAIK